MVQAGEQIFVTFQSHAGSIEADVRISPDLRWIARFNPTLVRLRRVGGVRLSGPAGPGFNPTLVRLRPPAGAAVGVGEGGFNPTLVRLRRGRPRRSWSR